MEEQIDIKYLMMKMSKLTKTKLILVCRISKMN